MKTVLIIGFLLTGLMGAAVNAQVPPGGWPKNTCGHGHDDSTCQPVPLQGDAGICTKYNTNCFNDIAPLPPSSDSQGSICGVWYKLYDPANVPCKGMDVFVRNPMTRKMTHGSSDYTFPNLFYDLSDPSKVYVAPGVLGSFIIYINGYPVTENGDGLKSNCPTGYTISNLANRLVGYYKSNRWWDVYMDPPLPYHCIAN